MYFQSLTFLSSLNLPLLIKEEFYCIIMRFLEFLFPQIMSQHMEGIFLLLRTGLLVRSSILPNNALHEMEC